MAIAPEKLKPLPDRLVAALYRAGMPEAALQEQHHLDAAAVTRALSQPPEPLCIEDLDLLQENGYGYELWEGNLVPMSPTKRRHAEPISVLLTRLGAYLDANRIGRLYSAEAGFRAGPGASVYCPDIAYLTNERAATVPLDEYFPFAPDIAIEAWSPDNTEDEMSRKAANYLTHGAHCVWLLRPQDKTIRVHRADAAVEILRGSDLLSGDTILPGFAVPVIDLFPA